MTPPAPCARQVKGWAGLKRLSAVEIDLARVALLRDAPVEGLSTAAHLERLLPDLGLNDERIEEFPSFLHRSCGQGLRVWQYPNQFAPYLAHVARLGIRSYLELGVRHGGSFVVTTEILARFQPLAFAVGVDVIPCPSMEAYARLNPVARFCRLSTQSTQFGALLDGLGEVDLVFVDSHHEEDQCRREVASVRPRAGAIALHDVANVGCPGVRRVWEELVADGAYDCFEYGAQYDGLGPYMGIGLAVRRRTAR